MSKYVHKLEVRLISPRFVVVKSTLTFSNRLIERLIRELTPRNVNVRWRSNSRLEFSFDSASCIWDDVEHTIMPLLINGRLASRCPGTEGFLVQVFYVEPAEKRYHYKPLFSVTYPQFRTCSEWMSVQRQLFGRDWDEADERTPHN